MVLSPNNAEVTMRSRLGFDTIAVASTNAGKAKLSNGEALCMHIVCILCMLVVLCTGCVRSMCTMYAELVWYRVLRKYCAVESSFGVKALDRDLK